MIVPFSQLRKGDLFTYAPSPVKGWEHDPTVLDLPVYRVIALRPLADRILRGFAGRGPWQRSRTKHCERHIVVRRHNDRKRRWAEKPVVMHYHERTGNVYLLEATTSYSHPRWVPRLVNITPWYSIKYLNDRAVCAYAYGQRIDLAAWASDY